LEAPAPTFVPPSRQSPLISGFLLIAALVPPLDPAMAYPLATDFSSENRAGGRSAAWISCVCFFVEIRFLASYPSLGIPIALGGSSVEFLRDIAFGSLLSPFPPDVPILDDDTEACRQYLLSE